MNDLEPRVMDVLARHASTIDVHPDLRAVLDDAAVVPVALPRRDPQRWAVLGIAVALMIVAVVAVAVLGGDGDSNRPIPAAPSAPPRLHWSEPHVELWATGVAIDYGGRQLSPAADGSEATSLLLSDTSEVLTIEWVDGDDVIHWELQLETDGSSWWVEGMSVLVGTDAAVQFRDDHLRAALGSAFAGDVDVPAEQADVPAQLVVTGMELRGFRDRAADGAYVDVSIAPAALLAAPPALPADVPATGLWLSQEDYMVTLVAGETLRRECMARAGFTYAPTADAVLIQAMGEWSPDPLLGIRRAGAARATGYHIVNAGFLNGGAEFHESLSADQQEAYTTALGGNERGCYAEANAVLGGPQDIGPMTAWAVLGDIRRQALDDPRVIDALGTWGDCVEAAVGERAPTPNELARRYAFIDGDIGQGTATEHEKAVAVADATCQASTDLQTVWFTAVTDRERAAMGDRVDEYDEWARQLQRLLVQSSQVLAERGIAIPSPD